MLFENYVGGATHHASRRIFVGAKCDQDVRDVGRRLFARLVDFFLGSDVF